MYYSQKILAATLDVSQSRLSNWFQKGFIPYKNAEMVEDKTQGAIKASAIKDYAMKLKLNKLNNGD